MAIENYLELLAIEGTELSADELVVLDDNKKKQSAGRVTKVGFVWTEFGNEFRQKFSKKNGVLVSGTGEKVALAQDLQTGE